MFGICIWFKLNENNYYNKIIKDLLIKLNLKYFEGHLTEKYNLNICEAKTHYNNVKDNNYIFSPINKIYSTSNGNFHSLQLDFSNNINEKIYHISLAYRIDRPFTDEEIEISNNIKYNKIIKKNDYTINIYDCDSINTENWKKII